MLKRVLQVLAVTAVAAATIVALPATADAQDSDCQLEGGYEDGRDFAVTPPVASAGETVLIESINPWLPGGTIVLRIDGAEIGTTDTDPETGSWSFEYVVPSETAAGEVVVEAQCGAEVFSSNFSVTAPSQPTTPAQPSQPSEPTTVTDTTTAGTDLPATGSDSFTWLQVGAALVALGAVLLVLSRRRLQGKVTGS